MTFPRRFPEKFTPEEEALYWALGAFPTSIQNDWATESRDRLVKELVGHLHRNGWALSGTAGHREELVAWAQREVEQ